MTAKCSKMMMALLFAASTSIALSAKANNLLPVPTPIVHSYMKDFLVSESEAQKRLEIMQMADEISNKIIEQFGVDMVAGVFFDHTPDFKVVVRTTKQGQKSRDVLSFVNQKYPNIPIEVIPNSPRNFRAIQNIITNQSKVLDKKISGFQSLGYDPSQDKLILSVYQPGAQARDLIDNYKIGKISGMDVEILLLDAPIGPAALMGGARLESSTGRCTSGFSVNDANGQPGIVTAYHCTNNGKSTQAVLTDNAGVRHSLTLQTPKASANHDMAVYLATTGTPLQATYDIYDGLSPMPIRSQGKRSELKAGGTYLCHSGVTTGFSCGTVKAINQPLPAVYIHPETKQKTQVCNTAQKQCNSTFVTLTGPSLKCAGGDSGGPVVNGTVAYGITSSCNTTEITQGKPALMYLSSLDFISELSVSIATTSTIK